METSVDPVSSRHSIRRIARNTISLLATTASILLVIVTCLSWGARHHWGLDLLTHFPVQLTAAGVALVALGLVLRSGKWLVLPLFVVIVNAGKFLPIYLPADQPSGQGRTFRGVSANVYTNNLDRTKFVEFIRERRPDFFLVMEVDDAWLTQLQELDAEYPYRITKPRPDNFGIGFYSRVPIRSQEVVEQRSTGLPTIIAVLDADDHELAILGVHPLPPVGQANSVRRNLHLQEIGDLAARLPPPKLVLGDLNVSPWSPHFTDVLHRGRLRDGRQGFGVQPTWPAWPWLLRIPIDHTLISAGIHVQARRLGPDVGSDHRPIELEFELSP
jgi:endonuclease/exonuclease/phosphatase (EEP) superfamily protein YafD